MDLILLELLRTCSSDGVSDDESCTGRQMVCRDLNDLAAIDFTDDALLEHLLGLVAILHESAVALQQVGETVGAEGNTTDVGDVGIAESLHALEEVLIGVGSGKSGGVIVAIRDSGIGQSLENVGVELYVSSARFATTRPELLTQRVPAVHRCTDETISSPSL